jgi:predicted AlkP superfamily pyrophosphatase or phosphodiesterase
MAVVIAALGLGVAMPLDLGAGRGGNERHVVIITIDGLRPEFYLDEAWDGPGLRGLMKRGAHAREVEPVFPSVTYPNHASIATGVRPARHGIAFNMRFDPTGEHLRWYGEAADFTALPIWEWARAASLSTAAVSWPSTVGARIDALVPEQDYYARRAPLELLLRSSTPGLFEQLGVTPTAEMFDEVARWDSFLTETAAAIVRQTTPRLLLLHLVEADLRQHRGDLDGPETRAAVRRIDGHLGALMRALSDAGVVRRTAVIVTGDHGFATARGTVFPNAVLARAGLRECPRPGDRWTATTHVAGAAAAVFVNPPGDPDRILQAEAALRQEAASRYTLIPRAELDRLGAMPGAAFGLEAAPGFTFGGSCNRGLTDRATSGTHGYLPSRPEMATGFIAAGDGIRAGVAVARMRLIDIAPTAARLLGLSPPPVEGRVLDEILQ